MGLPVGSASVVVDIVDAASGAWALSVMAVPFEAGGKTFLGRRPLLGKDREVHRVAPSAVRPLAMTAQDPFAVRAKTSNGRLRAVIEMVGLQLHAPHAQVLESMGEEKQLRLGVDLGAPERAPVPRPADFQSFVGHINVHVRGPADSLTARAVDDCERNVLTTRGALQQCGERATQLLPSLWRRPTLPPPDLLITAPAANSSSRCSIVSGSRRMWRPVSVTGVGKEVAMPLNLTGLSTRCKNILH